MKFCNVFVLVTVPRTHLGPYLFNIGRFKSSSTLELHHQIVNSLLLLLVLLAVLGRLHQLNLQLLLVAKHFDVVFEDGTVAKICEGRLP